MVKTEVSKLGIWCTVVYLCYFLRTWGFFFLFFVCFIFYISQQPGMIQLQS